MKRILICLLCVFLLWGGLCQSASALAGGITPLSAKAEGDGQESMEAAALAARNAYAQLLETFFRERRLPDGQVVEMSDGTFGKMEENCFAIADVDGDGGEELVLIFTTAPMAGMCLWVYGYDPTDEQVYQELSAFPGVTFFPDGLLQADASHNQGLSGEVLWPYTLMRYTDCAYEVIAYVDAWDKSLSETDYKGNPFPDQVDTDGAGAVYLLTQVEDGVARGTNIVSRSVYQMWRAGVLGKGEALELEYLELTIENIRAVSP